MMTFDLSESMATWIGNTTKNLAKGFATEGVGLPAAVAWSAKEYYTDVRNVTPPANGGTVASLALDRGKAKITVDMLKAFRVVNKVTGTRLANPLNWYLGQRFKKGRSVVKFEVSLSEFKDIERMLHARVGYMQSGWNAALVRFNAAIPSWVKSKNGPGSIVVQKTMTKMVCLAKNEVSEIRNINDMQRRIDYVSKKHKQRLERAALIKGDKILKENFK